MEKPQNNELNPGNWLPQGARGERSPSIFLDFLIFMNYEYTYQNQNAEAS